MAKIQTRVRVSLLMGKLAVSGKGSAFNVNDSTATARVLVDWLIRIGFLVMAAMAVLKPGINKRTNEKTKPFAAQHGKLFFIRMGSVAISEMTQVSGEVTYSVRGTLVG